MPAPNDLTPKDLELIADEESRYARTVSRVREAFKEKTDELDDDEKLARKLTAELVATRNEEEKQFLQSDENVAHGLARLRFKQTNALSDLSKQPYFARVVYNEKNRDVEFKLGVASFPEERIIDWRKGPVSKLYYDYEEGEEYEDEIAGVERKGVVKLKRAYRGRHDLLSQIELKDASYFKAKGLWRRFKKQGRVLFSVKDKEKVRELLKNHARIDPEELSHDDGYLSQILALISPEQFRLISSDLMKPVIIQGSAGTGKTTVALHRLAWLLFEGNSKAREEHSLVVMFNPTLAEYVKNILPSLGVHKVKIATYGEWARDIVMTSLPDEVGKKKGWVPTDELAGLLDQVWEKRGDYASRRFPSEIDHLVIDEAQDFTVPELRSLVRALPDKNQLTIAGDLGQKILENRDFGTWEEMLQKVDLSGVDVLNLSVAYRSTYQIYEIASAIRDPGVTDGDLKMFPRFGPDPKLTISHGFDEAAGLAKAWIEDVITIDQKAIGAVVCRTPEGAKRLFAAFMKQGVHGVRLGDAQHFEFTPGITVTDASRVKGLEFNFLLVFNPSEREYPATEARERNALYVAVTRAIYRLDFVCYEAPSALLPEFLNTEDLTAVLDEDDNPLRMLFDLTPGDEAASKARQNRVKKEGEDEEAEAETADMLTELESGEGVIDDDMDAEDDEGLFPEEDEGGEEN